MIHPWYTRNSQRNGERERLSSFWWGKWNRFLETPREKIYNDVWMCLWIDWEIDKCLMLVLLPCLNIVLVGLVNKRYKGILKELKPS
jgi:hypothetical protein